MQALFAEKIQGMDYFLVTQFSELNNQPEIKEILYKGYQVREETSDYVVFDLNKKIED